MFQPALNVSGTQAVRVLLSSKQTLRGLKFSFLILKSDPRVSDPSSGRSPRWATGTVLLLGTMLHQRTSLLSASKMEFIFSFALQNWPEELVFSPMTTDP